MVSSSLLDEEHRRSYWIPLYFHSGHLVISASNFLEDKRLFGLNPYLFSHSRLLFYVTGLTPRKEPISKLRQ
jgi:hypothetical protein